MTRKKPYEYHTLEYGTIYNATISNILEHTFGGRPKHRAFGNTFIFDPEELVRVGKAYNLTTKIQTKVLNVKEEYRQVFEDPEGSEAIRKGPADSNGDKNEKKSCISRVNGTQNHDEKGLIEEARPSIEPSEPSDPSNKNLEDSSTIISKSIYRLGHSDIWACHNCKLRGDRWFMRQHVCRESK